MLMDKEKGRVDSRDTLGTKGGREHFGWHCPWDGPLLEIISGC